MAPLHVGTRDVYKESVCTHTQRTTSKVIHYGSKNVWLEHCPRVIVPLGHRHKVRTKKHATHAVDLGVAIVACVCAPHPARTENRRLASGDAMPSRADPKCFVPPSAPITDWPGRNIKLAGLGVVCVWMNMLRR